MANSQNSETELSRIPMQSCFADVGLDTDICLYNGEILLETRRGRTSGNGCVKFSTLGGPKISFEVELKGSFGLKLSECTLIIPSLNCTTPAIVLLHRATNNTEGGTGWVTGIIVAGSLDVCSRRADGKPESVGRVQFHLLNFPDYEGSNIYQRHGETYASWRGYASFQFGQYKVQLNQFRNADKRRREARKRQAYAFTHVGSIEKVDGKLFSVNQAKSVLDELSCFFSFASGARCECVLPTGFQHPCRVVWRSWKTPQVAAARYNPTWFYKQQPQECFTAAERFAECWRDASKKKWLQMVIHLYLSSNDNHNGSYLALANTQITLEMLTWVALMEEIQLMSEAGFEKLSAADKIRALLFWLQIPHDIPDSFTELRRVAGNKDAAEVVTHIRNCIIHPTKKNREQQVGYSEKAVYQAWQLNMWYIERSLLRLIGYSGDYNNRTIRLKSEALGSVSWASGSSYHDVLSS